jgi:hypothetical protein
MKSLLTGEIKVIVRNSMAFLNGFQDAISFWCYDYQNDDIKTNDTQPNDSQHNAIQQNSKTCYAECQNLTNNVEYHYAECHSAESHGVISF